ncbi:MAG: AtpZ/AtpI family protein [Phycisphaerales bacterium]|jgi:F0F1-type ATP synthase assembly protein I|nr:AtpZ/AtpI family protein [Phycisphaerales bacterium]
MPDNNEPNLGRYLGMGLEVAVGVGLGSLVGWWLDKRYQWSWGMVIGAMIGLAGGMYLLIREAIRMNKD